MPTEREARMSIVLIESRPTPINVSLHGMRHTAACHRNTAPQKQPYASRYAASHKHVFRCDVYQCLVFQASTYRASFCMTSFSGTSKKAPRQCLVVWDMHIQATTNRPPGNGPMTSDTLHHADTCGRISSWRRWDTLLTPPSPHRLLAAVRYAQRAGEDRLEQDLLCQWPCAWHGLPFCQRSLVMRRSSHERALVLCQASR